MISCKVGNRGTSAIGTKRASLLSMMALLPTAILLAKIFHCKQNNDDLG